MQQDLLILKLLKLPVLLIRYLSKTIAILTYLPNYLLICMLDSIIFNPILKSTLRFYILTWPLRVVSLLSIVGIFCFQFYGIYLLLSISHLHWGIQFLLTVIAFQALLFLMRHGYLSMIQKFSPKKLKSFKEHLRQFKFIAIDILGIALTLVNLILAINVANTFRYPYQIQSEYRYLKHITGLIRRSIVVMIKLFYVKIFFRIFPWRYLQSIEEVKKEDENILNLMVLLSLLFFCTMFDLLILITFGIYCIIHPRRKVYQQNLSKTHEKYKPTFIFFANSLIQIFQCSVLFFCLPFKFTYAKSLLKLIVDGQNNYSSHYLQETFFVLQLTLVKIPSLICELFLFLSVYKYKKIAYLMAKKQNQIKQVQGQAGIKEKEPLFEKKLEQAAPQSKQQKHKKKNKYSKEAKRSERQYISIFCFIELICELRSIHPILLSTILKPWNIRWLNFLVDDYHDIRISYVYEYFVKNLLDYLGVIPCILSILLLGFYDPIKCKKNLKIAVEKRKTLRDIIPASNKNVQISCLEFFESKSSVMIKILQNNFTQIRNDILFFPLFVASRLSFLSLFGCSSPSNSVDLFQDILTKFYINRIKRTKYFQQYVQIYQIDSAAGVIKNQREKLRFWKFAYKSCKHRKFISILCFVLPGKIAEKIKANIKVDKKYSAISNHYWQKYQTTLELGKGFILLIVFLIAGLIGIIILLPLTLWRMPTFFILFKSHQYQKEYFFKILFKIYKQMGYDIVALPLKLFTLILFPRASVSFYIRNSFRYTKEGIKQFEKLQKAKINYIFSSILCDGLKLYLLVWKIIFVKLCWIRKKQMNQQLQDRKIKLGGYIIDFLSTKQAIPTIKQLTKIYPGFVHQQQVVEQKNNSQNAPNMYQKDQKVLDINKRGLEIDKIVSTYLYKTKDDLPYLGLMIFLLSTLPWRLFYIKNALFLLREDKKGRQQFLKLVKIIAKDYLCILLYFVLFISIVKTKRAFELLQRNFKLNFFVGTLKYSHLKQLKSEIIQTADFYYNLFLTVFACILAPYRTLEICRKVLDLYKNYKEQIQQEKRNKKMYENTIKQGKSLQILTQIGHNSLMHVFKFLNTKQLTGMTQVSKYMYDSIKQRDEVWMQQWQKVFMNKFIGFEIKNQFGGLAYQQMCVQKYKQLNLTSLNTQNRFFNLAISQYQISAFSTPINLKTQLNKLLHPSTFKWIFSSMRWENPSGFGPQQNWPQPDDNPQLLELMNIQRREIIQLSQPQSAFYLFFARPIEFILAKMGNFYDQDSHRKKKQLLFLLTLLSFFFLLVGSANIFWAWFWDFNMFTGYKILTCTYLAFFFILFLLRFHFEAKNWSSLRPFDLKDELIDKMKQYLLKPIKIVGNFFFNKAKLVGNKVKYTSDLFMQKIAKPLYISISLKIKSAWNFIKYIFSSFINAIRKILSLFRKLLSNIYLTFLSIVKSISKLYSNSLQYALRLSLRFGNVGELVFTILAIILMVSPSIFSYYFYSQRWFVVFSTLLTMVLIVTGYKHLSRMKARVLSEMKGSKN